MTNVKFPDISFYEDIETLNMYRERLEEGYAKEDVMHSIYAKSRDNARTPMQWSGAENAGFTTGTPWIALNPNYKEINADNERKDPESVYNFYRNLIRLRKEYSIFVDGKFELLLPEDEQIFAYTRTDGDNQMLVAANFTGEPARCMLWKEWKGAQVLIHNYNGGLSSSGADGIMDFRPYEAIILYK